MEHLAMVLKEEGYKKIVFSLSKTQHLLLKAKINGIAGDFILDTGASTTCIAHTAIDYFNLRAEGSSAKASGAGAVGMDTQVSHHNSLQLGRWKTKGFSLIVFDLSHVNQALEGYKARPVHGIIGADVLMQGAAIIDYGNRHLFLR